METIKRSRRRLAISLLIIVAMVFTMIPCIGADVAEADTNDLVQVYTPTQSCPVSKVEYVPQSDGQFNLKVTVNLDVFKKAGYPDGDYYWYDLSILNNGTGKYLAYEEGNLVSLSGERIYEYNKEKNPNYSLTQNQGITIKYSLLDANPQGDPETGEEPDPLNSPAELHCTAPAYPEDESVSFDERTRDCTSADKNTAVFSKSFKADSTKMFLASASHVDESGYGWDTAFDLQVTDSSGNDITRKTADSSTGYKYQWNFTKSDTYTFSLICKYGSSGKCAYDVRGELQNVPVETSSFTGFKAELIYSTNNAFMGVDVYFDSYDGTDKYGNNVFYREDVERKTITCVQNSTYHSERIIGYDDPPYLDTTYTYYVAKESALEDTLPDLTRTEGSKVALSASTKTKLQSLFSYATVKTPKPVLPEITSLSISTGVKKASLSWKVSSTENITGYQVERYYGSTLKKEYTVTSSRNLNAAIPYKGTSKFKVRIYYEDPNGQTYYGSWTALKSCTSKQISAATGSVTKISDKKARITIKKSTGSTGTIVYQYTGGKWVKLGSTTGSSYTTTKNTAGKKKYKLKSYVKDAGKTYYSSSYSKTYSPKANVATFSYSNYPSAYEQLSHYWRPDKIYYSGSKVVVNGKFINTHIYTLDYCKIKLTVKCQGKTIGTKTINSGKLKPNQVKKVTVKLDNSKTGYDLRAGGLSWSYKVISYY